MPKFHAEVKTGEAQKRLLLYLHAVPNELSKAVQAVADDAVLIFAGYAPKGKTGKLGRGIRAVSAQGRLSSGRFATGRQFAIVAHATNRGYDYVGVTRFGHRVKFIRPRVDRAPASVIATKAPRRRYGELAKGQRPALRFDDGSYRNVVRGVVRDHDWVQQAQGAVNRELDDQARKLANNLERRFG